MPTRPATPMAPATMAPVEMPCFLTTPPGPGCGTTAIGPEEGPGTGVGPGGGPSGPGTGVGPGDGIGVGAGVATGGGAPPRLLCPGGSHHAGRGLHALGAELPSCPCARLAVPVPYLPSG